MVTAPVYIPTGSAQKSLFPTSLPTLVIPGLFDKSQPNRYKVILHCGLDLHVPKD